MAYERQYYTNGDVLDARQLNHMETGIKENSDNIGKLSEDIATKASAIKEKACGEVIVVTDSDEQKPLGLAIDGKSEQTQYSGKNLIDARLNVDIKSNDTYKIYNIKPNTVYTLSLSQMLVALGTNTNVQHQFVFYDEADNILTRGAVANMVFASVGEVIEKVATISAPENASYLQIDLGTYFGSSASSTVKTLYAQLEEGSVATEIEPYVGGQPSPNPSYPQEIRNIGVYDEASGKYAVEVKCTGKNLLNEKYKTSTNKGITFTNNGDGTVTANGTGTDGDAGCILSNNSKELLDNVFGKQLIVSGCPSGGTSSTYYLQFWYRMRNGNTYVIIDFGNGASGIIEGDVESWNVAIIVKNGATVSNLIFKPMIRLAEIADDTYEPYKETTATVLLDEPLRKEDKAYWNGGSKVRVDRNRTVFKCLVADGVDSSGKLFSMGKIALLKRHDNTQESPNICCKNYIVYRLEEARRADYAITQFGENVYIRNKDFSTVEEFNVYLSENPLEFEGDLAEPITEEIDIDLGELSMFYPTTILSNDCNANMEVTYIADTKAYIDKKFAELATAMV